MRFSQSICGLSLACAASAAAGDAMKPSIILIMSDDQDRRLGSTDYQSVLHREIYSRGVEFVNHFATTAQCCPSHASFLRGQAAHNTNVTNVHAPGGNYDKWHMAGLDEDYLPHWLKKAGYKAEYVGKFLNGYNVVKANIAPKGWDHVDALNGERPVYYKGFHSTDVVRTKALERLQSLVTQDQPYYLQIAPYAPHVQNNVGRTVPLARHMDLFPGAKAPSTPNYNPDDEHHRIGGWPGTLPLMNQTTMDTADGAFRARAQALQGLDEIIEDAIAMLDANGKLDNTYVIYTSDNGYHIGQHRLPGGKALFYGEDTNLPSGVRGPGVPNNLTSQIPGVHPDLVPTFLDIAGLPKEDWPTFLDGHSLPPQWKDPVGNAAGLNAGDGNSKETLNVEFWDSCTIEAPNGAELGAPFVNTTYKTLRMLGDRQSWLFSAALNRLNALLLVTKSCAEGTCRDPWSVFTPSNRTDESKVASMQQAMDPQYDAYFAAFPRVHLASCMQYQDVANEAPFYPESAGGPKGLGLGARRPTDNFVTTDAGVAIADARFYGAPEQRHATLEQVYAQARNLTDEELAMPAAPKKGKGKGKGIVLGTAEYPSILELLHIYDLF
ncbi:Arylsulfatase [Apiospora aurea]|uniref:Arylsulfatase n=1 Tax=Apiospora aurea TaxID=335848 RepID=A0ABR1QLP4_9PEZI